MAKLAAAFLLAPAVLICIGGGDPENLARAAQGAVNSGPEMLRVAQDESSLEGQIKDFLSTRAKELKVLTVQANPTGNGDGSSSKDEVLLLFFRLENGMPDFRIILDTQRSARDPSRPTVVTERAVMLRLHTGAYVRPDLRNEALDLLNSQNRRILVGKYWLDSDLEVVSEWVLNVTAAGLPAENVYDALIRMLGDWQDFFPAAKPVLGRSK